MSVHQRRDTGSWFVKWRENGKQKTQNFGKNGEQDARDFDQHIQAQIANEVYEAPSLNALADLYFQSKHNLLHLKTRRDIIRYIIKACDDFNTKPCDQIGRKELDIMRRKLGNIKTVTKNKAQAYISSIFNWGVENEYLSKNPWLGAKKLKQEAFLSQATIDDFRTIMVHAAPHLKWAVEVSLNLALRPGEVELLNLKWSAFKWNLGYAEVKQGKGVGLKKVQLSDEFLAKAKARFEEDQKNGMKWVVHYRGRRIQSLRTAWKNAKIKAGYAKHPIRLYDIRHVAATELLAKGADPAAVQHQLGHKRLSTTMNTYSHVVAGAQQKAANMLPKLDED